MSNKMRELAAKHAHTRALTNKPDTWFAASGLTVRDVPGSSVAIKELPCPVEPSATAMIKYWAADKRTGIRHFIQASLQALAQADRIGSPAIWGWIKDDAPHLNAFLDQVVADGACRKVRGDKSVEGDFSGGTFYIADVDDARRWMNGR